MATKPAKKPAAKPAVKKTEPKAIVTTISAQIDVARPKNASSSAPIMSTMAANTAGRDNQPTGLADMPPEGLNGVLIAIPESPSAGVTPAGIC